MNVPLSPVDDPATLRDQAITAHRSGRRAEALPLYAAYLARVPGDASVWTNLGALLRTEGRHDQALRAQEKAFALDPTNEGIRNNLANILNDVGEHKRSLALRLDLIRDLPNDPNHLAMAGKSLRALGHCDEGIALLRSAVDRFPAYAELTIQLALTELAAGRYAEGFQHYAARWLTGELAPRTLDAPRWKGEPLDGKTILVLPEQGFGDALCFARFLPVLRRYNPARVALSCERPLLRLMAAAEGADWVGQGLPPEGFDVWVDLMDLPTLHFAADPVIPAATRLTVPEDSKARARRITEPFQDRFKVGIVWCGSVTYRGNAFRSFPHTELHKLVDIPGLQMVSLYKGPELAAFHADGTSAFVVDAGSSDRDFADCAAMMQEMDLVVTSDTATAHLAGSLGVPVWTLLHWDAFWLWRPDGDTTPWYPSMRLVRQPAPRDWAGVFAQLRAELAVLAAQPRRPA